MLAVYRLSAPVSNHPKLFINNFDQVDYESFFSWKFVSYFFGTEVYTIFFESSCF